jgi:hypothetical protein
MHVGLSNRDLQSHLDSLKKSVVVKFQLSRLPMSNPCCFQKSSYREHHSNYTEIPINYEVLHISWEHRKAQLSIFNSSQPPEQNVVYSIVSYIEIPII